MNALSEDIKDILVAESSLGLTFATDLFISKEPAKPADCVTIYDTPSLPPEDTLATDETMYNSSVQIRVRNKAFQTGMALARDIMDVLHGRAHETWNTTIYEVIRATGEPAQIGRDENDRVLIVINFNAKRR